MGRSRRGKLPQEPVNATIESIDLQSGGVARVGDRSVFIPDTLPGEEVVFSYTRLWRGRILGRLEQILKSSPDRIEPGCPQFGVCGGCTLQHWTREAQLEAKKQLLMDAFRKAAGVEPENLLEPLAGASGWGYRSKARLGVKYVPKRGRVLVGFRERGSGFLCETEYCAILDPRVGKLLGPLAEMIGGLSIRDQIPQIEVAAGDEHCVLVFRVLAPPSAEDRESMAGFCRDNQVTPWLQTAGPDSLQPLTGGAVELSYRLPAYGLRMCFQASDFTQVNAELNRLMVEQALRLLDLSREDRVLELFCGLGNFTLPMARCARRVVGVDADPGLIERAGANARANGIDNVGYFCADLYQPLDPAGWTEESFDKILLDPPRSGALEVLGHLARTGAKTIVYVSCCPDTLARDAGMLIKQYGYRLISAGVMDMFPHTAHVESIALFKIRE